MATTKTTKDDALKLQSEIQTLFNGQPWFKKIVLDDDDHGWCLNLHISKKGMEAAGFSVPHQTNVKVLIFNRD